MMSVSRPEYPRPQCVRDSWINLNGEWEFTFDHGSSGRPRKLYEASHFDGHIEVPFCPESSLSGVGYTDFIASIWYHRTFTIPDNWKGKRVLIHFGAVDYSSEVWVNGKSVGKHEGGYTSFTFEITDALISGENSLIVCADDNLRNMNQPAGKQCTAYASCGCLYTRTTGIWQTVWLEAVPQTYIEKLHLTPDVENSCLHIKALINGPAKNCCVSAKASLCGVESGCSTAEVTSNGSVDFILPLDSKSLQLWEPGNPILYDLTVNLLEGDTSLDSIDSYFGMRSLDWTGPAIRINGKPIFQRLILDQGFYPDGIYTAPSDEELRADIERSMAMGFNGARLHQKVFEERYLYWADKLGYLVWGEMANWGIEYSDSLAGKRFISEWVESVDRDYSHPSLIGWCPFNETPNTKSAFLLSLTYRITKQMDPTRPVIDTSGYFHTDTTDVYDSHDYEQDPSIFKEHYTSFAGGGEPRIYPNPPACDDSDKSTYKGQPFFVSEYGGIWWNPDAKEANSWGYGNRPVNENEFLARYKGLTEVLLSHPRMCGFCYTQLTDVEQETNGLYTYNRRPKFDPALIRAINSQKAAIEKDES